MSYLRNDDSLTAVIEAVDTDATRTGAFIDNEVHAYGGGKPEMFGFGATQAERDAQAATEIVDRVLSGGTAQRWEGHYRDGAWT
ncbi:hypothetical protein RND64_08825 [Gordonia sp. w5E2]|uniref:Uncharacterized protein n=1 Tax=Gordonia jacobaea TaxID=122202 RepID=A0ABR5IH84_9ACTN|nr:MULTISPECIES: hypothetical protein [Gordonia]KNA92922.1 hypothetical protein ABW18_00090 [Gordonia jacobaea]